MISNVSIDVLRIKSLEDNSQDHDLLYEKVTEQDKQYFEDYLRYIPCSQCGKDHRFKPSYDYVQSSIDNASELLSSFFKGEPK